MEISDRVSNYMALLNGETVKPAAQSAVAAGSNIASDPSFDHVTLSSTADPLAEDEIRRERLDLIRQQLAEGSYNISGKDVADKIIKVLKS